MTEYVSSGHLAGGVTLVARRGEIVFLEPFGFRDKELSDPMRHDSIFRIASHTKAVVSVAIMMLQESGKLHINEPVANYLPEFANTTVALPDNNGSYSVVPAKRQITIRDLLTHTSGISYGTGVASDRWQAAGIQGWYTAHLNEPIRETVRRMASLPFDAQPGERWVYGYNTDILGALVEAASGLSLDVYLQSEIFDPLDMADTHFYLPSEKQNRLTTVYSAAEAGIVRTPEGSQMQSQGQYLDGPRISLSGGAGLLSTASDYGRFLQMLLNRGELDGIRILSPKTVELMTVNHVGDLPHFYAGNGFGLGFSIRQDLGSQGTPGSLGEFSWLGAYHSIYWVDPEEQLVVVYLSQLIPAGSIDDHVLLRNLVYQAIVD
jgi:CubicO group peptidase (beta-lactamase class C family)